MTALPQLPNQMFLSAELEAYVTHVNRTHAECLSFAKRLNEIGHRALFNAKITRTDLQHVLLAALLQRALKAFQASIILFERGLPEEAHVALRTLLEVTFKTVAVAKHKDVAEAFVLEDETHRRRYINKYKMLSPGMQDPVARAELDAVLARCQAAIDSSQAKELGTYWFAQKADMLDFYNSVYAILSSTAHANVRTLEGAFDLDADGTIRQMKYGFSDEGMDTGLLTASESLILTLRAGFSLGDIPASDVADIHAMHDEFKSLHTAHQQEA